MKTRLIIISLFSFFKRMFFASPQMYNIIVFLPLLTVFNTKTSKKSLIFVLIFLLIIIATGNLNVFFNFLPICALMIYKPSFEGYSFEATLTKLIYLYVILCLYGIFQLYFGFTSFENSWINSDLGTVGSENFNIDTTIRPFSTFAGIPEFTFFCVLFAYYFYIKKKNVLFLTSIIMILISGSRGILISTLIAFFVIYFLKNNSYKRMIIKGFLVSFLFFIGLIFVYPLLFQFSYDSSSRLIVYGTFNGRVFNWIELLDKGSYLNFLFGNFNSTYTESTTDNLLATDNLYLSLILKLGIFGLIYFFSFFRNIKLNEKSVFFLIIFMGYGFYADVIFSYYLMFPFFFAVYSKK
jgi:hypothetical protein